MTLGVHQVDGRIAANAAIKIRAALAKSVDAKKVITDYAHTHPTVSEFISQDRARARAWAMHNVTLDHEALDLVLRKHYADMYVTGVLSTYDAYGKASRSKKAVKTPPHNWADAWAVHALSNAVNWDTWKPGNEAAAALLKPPGGLEKLLNGIKIQSLDMKKSSYDLLGSQLADGIAIGASPTRLASMIEDSLSTPERSLMIALTEGSRAANTASKDAYAALGVEQIEWVSADPDDEDCDIGGEVTEVDGEFSNGLTADDLPVHPNCRCSTLPLVPDGTSDFVDNTDNADN
jgi:hypothetical protein